MKPAEADGICFHHLLRVSLLPGDFFPPVPCAALQEEVQSSKGSCRGGGSVG